MGNDRDLGFSRGHQGRQGHRPHDDDPPLKAHCAKTKIQFSQLWDLIETWVFREDIKDVKAIGLMMMTPPPKSHCAKTKIKISQLWDLIETWGFREDLHQEPADDPKW